MSFVFQEGAVKRNRIVDVVNWVRLGYLITVLQFLVWTRESSLFRSVKNKMWGLNILLSISYFGDNFLGDNATGRKADHASHLVQSFRMSGEMPPLSRILYCARVRIYHIQKYNKKTGRLGA